MIVAWCHTGPLTLRRWALDHGTLDVAVVDRRAVGVDALAVDPWTIGVVRVAAGMAVVTGVDRRDRTAPLPRVVGVVEGVVLAQHVTRS